MKKILYIFLALAWTVSAFAQDNKIPQRLEIVTIDDDDDDAVLEMFDMPTDGQSHYFLSVGHLGFGDEIIQVQLDPLFELFLPLGDTLDEAQEALGQMQDLFKQSVGTSIEVTGNLALGYPRDDREPVKVAYKRFLLSRMLEFSVERDGYMRAAHIGRADFNSLITSLKLYRKIHPNEK